MSRTRDACAKEAHAISVQNKARAEMSEAEYQRREQVRIDSATPEERAAAEKIKAGIKGLPGRHAMKSRHRHVWAIWTPDGLGCACSAVKDEAATRKGRNNRKRGNAFEVTVARKLKRVLATYRKGQYGGKTDVGSSLVVVQCKKVASLFPKRINALLREVEAEATADQFPMVALSNVPGAGGTTQELVVMDLNDLANLLDIISESGDMG